MNRGLIIAGFILVFTNSVLCQATEPITPAPSVRSMDTNNDGRPDMTYYAKEERLEADSNYDGKPDVVINMKDGNFQSAEIDSDYNGSVDKKITDKNQFDQWVNSKPELKSGLSRFDREEARFNLMQF